jgi:hypothetical protein
MTTRVSLLLFYDIIAHLVFFACFISQSIRLTDMVMVQTDPTLPPRLAQLEGRGWVGANRALRFSICYVDEVQLHGGREVVQRNSASLDFKSVSIPNANSSLSLCVCVSRFPDRRRA